MSTTEERAADIQQRLEKIRQEAEAQARQNAISSDDIIHSLDQASLELTALARIRFRIVPVGVTDIPD